MTPGIELLKAEIARVNAEISRHREYLAKLKADLVVLEKANSPNIDGDAQTSSSATPPAQASKTPALQPEASIPAGIKLVFQDEDGVLSVGDIDLRMRRHGFDARRDTLLAALSYESRPDGGTLDRVGRGQYRRRVIAVTDMDGEVRTVS